MKERLDEMQHHCRNASIEIRRTALRWLQSGTLDHDGRARLVVIFRAASRIEAACKGEIMAKAKSKTGGWKTVLGGVLSGLAVAAGAAAAMAPQGSNLQLWATIAAAFLGGTGIPTATIGVAHKFDKLADAKCGQ